MTCGDIISAVNELKPNEFSDAQKLAWLTTLDRLMFADILLENKNYVTVSESAPENPTENQLWWNRDAGDDPQLFRFDGETWREVFPYRQTSDRLLFGADAMEVYRLYLMAEIDFYDAEYARYNNESARFNASYAEFERAYSRTHGAKKAKRWAF